MTTEDQVSASAGQMLLQGREQRQLSVQQVALQLNLKPEQVIKLEQDQFDNMPETFARGYVRAYGRLLKLPESPLMAAYAQQSGREQSITKPMRTFSNRTAKQATENRFMWLTYGIILLLVVLLFIWWWQTARVTVSNAEQPGSEPEVVISATVTDVIAEPPQPTPEQFSEMLELLVPAEENTAESTAIELVPVVDLLEMRFSENCWVDVLDADGNRVAFGTKQAGYIMQLSGKAPFTVTLGNPSVVKINFNQQAVDMSALAAGRVAKFTIPESD